MAAIEAENTLFLSSRRSRPRGRVSSRSLGRKAARQRERQRKRQQIAACHPPDRREADMQIARKAGKRHIDECGVELCHERANSCDADHFPNARSKPTGLIDARGHRRAIGPWAANSPAIGRSTLSWVEPVPPSRGNIRVMLLSCASSLRSVVASSARVTLNLSS